MNIETLNKLCTDKNAEIKVNVGGKIYITTRDWVDLGEDNSIIVNLSKPIKTYDNEDIKEKLGSLGFKDEPTLENILSWLREYKKIYINVKTEFISRSIFSSEISIMHTGTIVCIDEFKEYETESGNDYDGIMYLTINKALCLLQEKI
jgi:hypothetical protein